MTATAVVTMATIAALAFAGPAALAQSTPIYRCGNVYSQWPCEGARTVVVEAAPTPDERSIAARTAAAQARWAERMQAERVAVEARRRPALAVSVGAAPPSVAAKPGRSPGRHATTLARRADSADFVAHVPAPPKQRSTTK